MSKEEKTPEQVMRDFKNGTMYLQPKEQAPPDFHTMALLAAQTIASGSIQELLSNADKIEYWLNEPIRRRKEHDKKIREAFM